MKKLVIAASSVITAIVILASVNGITSLLYKSGVVLKRGYVVSANAQADAAQAAAKIAIGKLFQNANADNGKKIFAKCATCHMLDQSGKAKVGPNLYGIVGKKRASMPGFDYSKAMKEKEGNWTYEDLFHFINAPRKFIKGTKMGFSGLKSEQDLADVIIYLKSMSNDASPLPKPDETIDPLK